LAFLIGLTFGDSLETISAMKENAVSKKPVEVKNGNVTVKIYAGKNRVNGASYSQFTLVYYSGDQRIKRKFADLKEARREAEIVAAKLASGENEVLRLTSTDRLVYLQALTDLRPLNRPLNVAVGEYVHALNRLPQGVNLTEAVDFFLRRNPTSLPHKTVREVVDDMIATKRQAGRGAVHIKDMESRLGRFADAFQMNIEQVTGPMIERYLASLDVTGRTKQNHLRLITSLFKFAIRRKCLPKDALDELQAVEKPEETPSEIEIFSPNELREILTAARPELKAWLSIAAFAGLRTAEIQRLDWSEVNLTERHIEVPALKSKTASRRLAPITDNLLAWLTPLAKTAGRVTGFENMAKQICWLVDDVNDARKTRAEHGGQDSKNVRKFKWKRNGLRHSFISYRLAAIKNAAQVALEAGNSPTMIFKHYRQLVTESEATKWFSNLPEQENGTNVIALSDIMAVGHRGLSPRNVISSAPQYQPT
jgi:integrase